MKIGVLTSSRADFGIYYPLLKELKEDSFFDLEIIAFGTHLQKEFGYTITEIEALGFSVKHKIITSVKNDSPQDISNSIGNAIVEFSKLWNNFKYDLVLAFGDRYEMFAAVSAACPFNVKIAHFHAGETTLGAIDNAYRHSISLMSNYQFVSTDIYKERAQQITENSEFVFNVGALSIDNLLHQDFYTKKEFYEKYSIDMEQPSILITFHPETVNYEKNEEYIIEVLMTLNSLKERYQIIITMPNSDTMGNMIREKINQFSEKNKEINVIESFGMKGYLSCMKYCSFLLGNTSSGFVEASFFPKWVINLGERQRGRIITDNIVNSEIIKEEILKSVRLVEESTLKESVDVYGKGNAAQLILDILKKEYES